MKKGRKRAENIEPREGGNGDDGSFPGMRRRSDERSNPAFDAKQPELTYISYLLYTNNLGTRASLRYQNRQENKIYEDDSSLPFL